MNIAAAVITAPRRRSYLDQTLYSLADAGFDDLTIISDTDRTGKSYLPSVPRNFLHYRVYSSRIPQGPKPTFRRALETLLVQGTEAVAVFEDDVKVALGLRDWLSWPAESVGCLSPYVAACWKTEPGWSRLEVQNPAKASVGACALLFPHDSARRFLAEDPWSDSPTHNGQAVAEWCNRSGLGFWVYTPSLVQHVGEVSTFHPFGRNGQRMAGHWCEDVSQLTAEMTA